MAYAFNQLSAKSAEEARIREYEGILERLRAFQNNNPNMPIPISGDDLSLMMSVDARSISERFGDDSPSYYGFLKNLRDHDSSFLYDFKSSVFDISGAGQLNGLHPARSINYYYVGMMSAAQGGSAFMLDRYVEAWNVKQATFDAGGWPEIKQIGPAKIWARQGHEFYSRGGW